MGNKFEAVDKESLDSLKVLLNNYYNSMSSRNWLQYKTFFWEHATLTTIWQKPGDSIPKVHITTVEDFISQAHLGPGSKPIFEEYMTSDPIIVLKNNIATASATYHVKFGTKDNLMEWDGRDVFTLLKHQGQWKIVSIVY